MYFRLLFALTLLLVCLLCPLPAVAADTHVWAGPAAETGVWVSYGFGFLNPNKRTGRIEEGRNYDFFQIGYLYERRTNYPKIALFFEPFAAYVNRPADGADVGFNVGLKYYFLDHASRGPYVTAGTGTAYTTTWFHEQGTHLLFILQAGIGYRYKQFFIEDRFRHYSNGRTASPNRSVHANIIMVGMYF